MLFSCVHCVERVYTRVCVSIQWGGMSGVDLSEARQERSVRPSHTFKSLKTFSRMKSGDCLKSVKTSFLHLRASRHQQTATMVQKIYKLCFSATATPLLSNGWKRHFAYNLTEDADFSDRNFRDAYATYSSESCTYTNLHAALTTNYNSTYIWSKAPFHLTQNPSFVLRGVCCLCSKQAIAVFPQLS